jgi:hypothetical protein
MKHLNPHEGIDPKDPGRQMRAQYQLDEWLRSKIWLHMRGLVVSVSGNTYPVKDTLKALGMKFNGASREWSYTAKNADDMKAFIRKLNQAVELVDTDKKIVDVVNSL